MNNKALSPLVSTIALVFFAAVLGLVVMSWGKTYSPHELKACEDISVSLISISGAEICYTGSELIFIAENRGSVSIDGLKIFVIGKDNIDRLDYDESIGAADIKKVEASYNFADAASKVKITPKIEQEGEIVLCPNQGYESGDIKMCGD